MAQEVEIIAWLETERGDKISLPDLCSIGRETSNNIILNTSAVSRHHALIHKRDNEFWMVDLGGINGVQINNRRVIQPVCLQIDDRIQIPSATFIFRQAMRPLPAQPDEKKDFSEAFETVRLSSPVSARQEEQKELLLTNTPEPAAIPPQPDEESHQETIIEPQIKAPNERKKSRPKLPPSLPLPRTSGPSTVCGMAKQSMYIGLASIFLPFLGLITAVVAIFLGHTALKKIKQSNGTLIGKESAVMGLYFGYITLALILTYSSIFYFIYFSSPTQPDVLTKLQNLPASVPITLTPSSPNTPTPPPPAENTNSSNSSGVASPVAASNSSNTQSPPSPEKAPPTQDIPAAAFVARAPATLRSDPSLTDTPLTKEPAATSPTTETPAAPANTPTPPAFSYEVQSKLRDGMLAQSMPADSMDRSYQDAEAFNNCARILARQPEAKYAESVKDFLDDVKTRNPDPARLQILSAMYENYMSALNKSDASGN